MFINKNFVEPIFEIRGLACIIVSSPLTENYRCYGINTVKINKLKHFKVLYFAQKLSKSSICKRRVHFTLSAMTRERSGCFS